MCVCMCVCVCALFTQSRSLALSNTHTYKSSHSLSYADSAGIISKTCRGNFTQAMCWAKHHSERAPRGLQLDLKYLSKHPGVLITPQTVENGCGPPEAGGLVRICVFRIDSGPEISQAFLCCWSTASDRGSSLGASELAAVAAAPAAGGVLWMYL